MTISFGSINTGLPKDIVSQIMEAEKIPIKQMESRKNKILEKEKLVQELSKLIQETKGSLGENNSSRSLRELVSVTKDEILSVNIDKNIALPGTYQFEVVKLAQKSSALSNGFRSREKSNVGVGFIQYHLPNGTSKSVYIDSSNATLDGVAKLINNDPSNKMRASVINDGSGSEKPWRLIISLEETGDDKKAHFPYFYFVDGEDDFFIEEERKSHNAIVKLDGFEIELPSNETSDLIPGLNLDLKKAAPGEEFSLIIKEDIPKITEKIEDVINKMNDVFRFIKQQNAIDASSDTTRTLGGDILLQTVESRLRNFLFKFYPTEQGSKRLGDLGIEFTREGILKFNKNKFESELSKGFEPVAQLLTGYVEDGEKLNGAFNDLFEVTLNLVQKPNGPIGSREQGLKNNIDAIDRSILNRQRILDNREKNLKDKFARLEGSINQIKSQGAGLASLGSQGSGGMPGLS